MSKQDKDSKVLAWTVVGGVVGIGAIALFLALRRKESPLNAIGETIANIGSILESNQLDEPGPVRDFEKKLRKNENALGEAIDWIATGISLWRKFKH